MEKPMEMTRIELKSEIIGKSEKERDMIKGRYVELTRKERFLKELVDSKFEIVEKREIINKINRERECSIHEVLLEREK
jgi:hypothetical protein